MIDILYIVGTKSQWGNNELRYSLRSIAKHGKGIRNVIIAGYVPRFVNRETCVCLDIKDRTQVKHWNILNTIIEVCKRYDITDDFLLSADDHFYFRDTDFDNYPIYTRGELPVPEDLTSVGKKLTPYRTTLCNTRALLEKYGYPTTLYCWHGNTHLSRSLILSPEFQTLAKEANTMPEGCEPTCLVLNILRKHRKFKSVEREDGKLYNAQAGEQTIDEILADRECLSATNEIGGTPFHDYLAAAFPTKCKYEV